jgi:hypothetical protein
MLIRTVPVHRRLARAAVMLMLANLAVAGPLAGPAAAEPFQWPRDDLRPDQQAEVTPVATSRVGFVDPSDDQVWDAGTATTGLSEPATAVVARPAETSASGPLEIDGPPVTVEVDPGGSVQLPFDWDFSVQVAFWYRSCSNMHVKIFGSYPTQSLDLACGFTENPSPTWREGIPPDANRLGDPGEHVMTFEVFDLGDPDEPASITVQLVSGLPVEEGRIVPAGDQHSLGSLDRYRTAWVFFDGVEGQELTLKTLGTRCYGRYRVRQPDLSILVDHGSIAVDGCRTGIVPERAVLDLGPLPATGTYRIELNAGFSDMGSGSLVWLDHTPPPQLAECQDRGVDPVALVHGFNSGPSTWDAFQPWMRSQVAKEFEDTGLDPERAEKCAVAFVWTPAVGPLSGSFTNALLLADQLRTIEQVTGADEVDLVVHSKGGLDSRAMIMLTRGDLDVPRARSLAMIATPNAGTPLADIACAIHRHTPGPAGRLLEKPAGPCRDANDALFGLTEEYVQDVFNGIVPNELGVHYMVVAGDSGCSYCRALRLLMGPNDGLVPVDSVEHFWGPYDGHSLLGEFDLAHSPIKEDEDVFWIVYCGLVRSRYVEDCANMDSDPPVPDSGADAAPRSQATDDLVHYDALEVPAGGSESVTLPVAGSGPSTVTILVDRDGLSASAGGVEFDSEATDESLGGLTALTAEIESSDDVELVVSNSGTEVADALVLVLAGGAARLEVVATPAVAAPGQPVEVRVPDASATGGLEGLVSGPDEFETALTFSADGPDAIAEFIAPDAGTYPVSVRQAGERQRVAFTSVVVGTGAASLPGSFTESVVAGPDGLAVALHVDVDVEVAEAGSYRLAGALTTAEGTEAAAVSASAELAVGVQQLRLTVPGPVLYAAGEGGPYRLDLTLLSVDGPTGLETVEARVAPASATAAYQAGDFLPATVTPGFALVEQGNFDTAVAEVPVTLSEPVTRPVSVAYESVTLPGDEYAVPGEDFEPVAGSLLIPPGLTSMMVPVTVYGDPDQQQDKLAVVEFSDPAGVVVDGDGRGGVRIVADPP